MSLFKKSELLSDLKASRQFINEKYAYEDVKSFSSRRLIADSKYFSEHKTYDIFLSHSYDDEEIIFQLKLELEKYGLSVYVDWIEDKQLDRSKVTKETAEIIRKRLKNCKSLVYAISPNSKLSSWVQWELGFADGHKNRKVAILPIDDDSNNSTFYKQEYLGLYPYIDKTANTIWVNGDSWIDLKSWLSGEKDV
jgi:hypothetical protein